MKRLVRFTVVALLAQLFAFEAPAAFTSLYVFGDGVSTTTNNTGGPAYLYYGRRFSNGRVWVEVLAQRQGLTDAFRMNWSYYGHDSSNLVSSVNSFTAPADVGTALFAVWVNDADFVNNLITALEFGRTTDISFWTPVINQALTNHLTAIQTLYAKGVRTLVMPNAVDIMEVPTYTSMAPAVRTFMRQRVIDFNTGFAAIIDQARTSLPGLTIYLPDFFTLLDTLLAHPGNYGLINPGIGAIDDLDLLDISLKGPGANYLFWDDMDPSAKAHAVMADLVQQLIAPPKFSNITWLSGSNRLDLANVPIGRNGYVQGSTNFVNWAAVQSVTSTNATLGLLVPAAGPRQFYRLRFPFTWSWP